MNAESRVEKPHPTYVPRDEQFEETKRNTFSNGRLQGVLHNLLPSLMANISANNHDFRSFSDIDSLYSEGLLLKLGLEDEVLKKLPLPKVVGMIQESSQGDLLKYNTPKILSSKHALSCFFFFSPLNTKICSFLSKNDSDYVGEIVILVTNMRICASDRG